jgi:hypothetical protein
MTTSPRSVLAELHRLLKEATGEAKWDDYLVECSLSGTTPMSRRAFEQHRAHQKECNPQARCC